MIVAVDFDGTCVEHEYPKLGPDVPGAEDALKKLAEAGARLILWTMRSGEALDDAVEWFTEKGIALFGVNTNPQQKSWTDSPKAYANLYIDDAAVGTPLVHGPNRPYVDWEALELPLQRFISTSR